MRQKSHIQNLFCLWLRDSVYICLSLKGLKTFPSLSHHLESYVPLQALFSFTPLPNRVVGLLNCCP